MPKLRAVFIIGLTNDVNHCFFAPPKDGSPHDGYPESTETLWEQKEKWCRSLAELLGCPVIYCGGGTPFGVRFSLTEEIISLGDCSRLSTADRNRVHANALAQLFMKFQDACDWGSFRKVGPYAYNVQKPRLDVSKCDHMGHPGKTEAWLQALVMFNTMAFGLHKLGADPTRLVGK